ncbi:MAG: ATP synthase F0 subunit B [bacterium]|nr:ATP synthase F0 subunit B [bacterium]
MLLSIDGTLIFVFFSFVIFIGLMNLICYKPIMKVIEEREKFLEKNQKTLLETKNKTNEVIKGVEEEISKTKLESSKMLKNAMDMNSKKKEEVISNKKTEIFNSLNEFESGLNQSSNSVKEQLKSEIGEYVKNTVSKVLKMHPDEINVDTSKINEILK